MRRKGKRDDGEGKGGEVRKGRKTDKMGCQNEWERRGDNPAQPERLRSLKHQV